MEESEKFYVTYKFYDERCRRLAIFASIVPDTTYLDIYVVTCGEKDRFTRKKANLIFNGRKKGDSMKGWFQVKLKEGNKPKYEFIEWCQDNYFKLVDATFQFDAKVFMKGKDDTAEFLDEIIPTGEPIPVALQEKPKKEVK